MWSSAPTAMRQLWVDSYNKQLQQLIPLFFVSPCSPLGMLPQARSTCAALAIASWSARAHRSASLVPDPIASASSIWPPAQWHLQCPPCRACAVSPVATARTRFWWAQKRNLPTYKKDIISNLLFLAVQHLSQRSGPLSTLQEGILGGITFRQQSWHSVRSCRLDLPSWQHWPDRGHNFIRICKSADINLLWPLLLLIISIWLSRQDHGGMYILYIAFFVISACMLARSVYYFRLKVSAIDGPL